MMRLFHSDFKSGMETSEAQLKLKLQQSVIFISN